MRITCECTRQELLEPLVCGEGAQDEMYLGSAYVTLAKYMSV